VLDLVGLGRAGEHHGPPQALEVDDQIAGGVERLDLVDERHVERLLGGADVLPQAFLDLVAAQ
jgi:hypothetical protein